LFITDLLDRAAGEPTAWLGGWKQELAKGKCKPILMIVFSHVNS
jgi:hypothetical protein